MARGSRGSAESVAFWEEIPHLRVEKTANPVAIYKRLDAGLTRPLEERPHPGWTGQHQVDGKDGTRPHWSADWSE